MNRTTGVLVATCVSSLVVNANSSAVTILLPAISKDIGTPVDTLQWAVTGYALVGAASIVTAGALGDIFGRRKIFLAGLALFVASCVLIALARSGGMVIAGRAIQGAAGSTLLAAGMSLIATANTGAAKTRAVALWGAAAAVGAAAGPLVGGVLVSFAGWQGLFWIDAAIAAACIPLTLRTVTESRDPNRSRSVDYLGTILVATILAPLVLALTEGTSWGWLSAKTLGCFALSLAAVGGFVFVEQRSPAPLVDLKLLRNRVLVAATWVILVAAGAINAIMYVVSLYFQDPNGLRMSPLKAGLAVLPMAVGAAVLAPLITPIVGRLGTRRTVLIGALCLTASFLALAFVTSSWTYIAFVIPLLIMAVGMSLQNNPATAVSTTCVPPEQVGVASGISNMARYVGISVMTAMVAAIYAGVAANRTSAGDAAPDALAAAVSRSATGLAVWCALGVLVARLVASQRPKETPLEQLAVAAASPTHTVAASAAV